MKNEKKVYSSPKIQNFGTVSDLTQTIKYENKPSDGNYLGCEEIPLGEASCGICP